MKKQRLSIFDKLMLFAAILAAMVLVLGTMAGNYNPKDSIWVAFAGLAYPFLLILNLLFVLFWLFRKKYIISIITIVVIGLGYKTVFSTYRLVGQQGGAERDINSSLRLMTYNVHQFKKYGENNDISTRDQILDVIAAQNPDVICFQEFFTRKKGEYDLIDTMKSRLGLKHYYFLPAMGNDYEEVGLAIFSRFPITNKGEISFVKGSANQSIYVDLSLANSKKIRVYNVHFQSISFQPRDYEYIGKIAKMDADYGPTKRIASMLKSAFVRRAEQVALMKTEMSNCELPYVIAGDFNDTPASFCVTQIMANLKCTFREKGSGFGKTYNGAFPNFQIDYIAASKDFDVINHHVSSAKLSDHFPVRSDLKLNNLESLDKAK